MKKRSNNEDESRMVTGVAWYRPEQWQRFREVAEDVENLEESYEAWLQTAERLIREGIPAHIPVEKVNENRGQACDSAILLDAKPRYDYLGQLLHSSTAKIDYTSCRGVRNIDY